MSQNPKIELKDFFRKGVFIDAIDSVSSWCLGQVSEVCHSDNTIKVKFDGWSSRWDEVF